MGMKLPFPKLLRTEQEMKNSFSINDYANIFFAQVLNEKLVCANIYSVVAKPTFSERILFENSIIIWEHDILVEYRVKSKVFPS
jgi:hypothetical protein